MDAIVDRPAARAAAQARRPPRAPRPRGGHRAARARRAARATRTARRSCAAPTARWCSSARSCTGCSSASTGGASIDELAAALSERLGRARRARARRRARGEARRAGAAGGHRGRRAAASATRCWRCAGRRSSRDPRVTRRITRPFTLPLHARGSCSRRSSCFAATLWFVAVEKGIASATAQAFDRPGLLLLITGLVVLSAGFHELGHAAACRYGGATPGGIGVGLYLVWPAFYTDVTDAYRLPRRDRLRVDLGGLYFNALVAVVTHGRLAAHGRRRAAAARRAPGDRDGQAALAGHPRRRLPHPRRPHGRPGPLRAHRPDAAPALPGAPRAVRAARPRAGHRDAVGARRRAVLLGAGRRRDPAAAAARRLGVGVRHELVVGDARRRRPRRAHLGRSSSSRWRCRCWRASR